MERQKENNLYQEIISDMSLPVCCCQPDGSITYKNESFSKIFVSSNTEHPNFFNIFHPSDSQNIRLDLEKLNQDNPINVFRHSFLGPDQKVSWYDLKSQAIFDQKQEVVEYRCLGLDCTAQQQEIEKLQQVSLRDELTGLYNRHFVVEELKRFDSEINRKANPDFPPREHHLEAYSIIFCDLNDLKKVNDLSPDKHTAGDELLKQTALIITRLCRDSDLVARWGGDEFLVVLPETTFKKALIVKDRIFKSCTEKGISLAMGLAQKNLSDDYLQVIDRADQKMYQNKKDMKHATLSSI